MRAKTPTSRKDAWRTADAAIVNAKIITADDGFSIAEAVAICDGKFVGIGSRKADSVNLQQGGRQRQSRCAREQRRRELLLRLSAPARRSKRR